jgi:hypothetical protein
MEYNKKEKTDCDHTKDSLEQQQKVESKNSMPETNQTKRKGGKPAPVPPSPQTVIEIVSSISIDSFCLDE